MKKHLILLLVVVVALASAPAAMAQSCQKCKPAILACADVETGGWEFCKWTVENNCYYHTPCTSLQAAASVEPLAAEYIVASVERLDEPQAAASETLVASLETPAPVTHR